MKRFFLKQITAVVLMLVMVFSLCTVRAEATAFASLSGKSVVRAGNDVTLTLKVSGTNIMGIEAMLDYDEKVLEYRSYRGLVDGWDVVPNGEQFVMWSVNNPIKEPTDVLSLTFRVKEDVAAGTALEVSFQNVTVSDEERELGVGAVAWSGTVMTAPQNTTPVAFIDGVPNVKYMTLQDAVDAAENGDVIKMLSDYVLEDELEIDKICAENGYYEIISKEVSFDLCGYTFNLKGGAITGGFDFENGCLNISDDACVSHGDIRTQSGVVNIKGGEISGLNISGKGSCSIWAGSFPGMWNDAIKPYLVSEIPFYQIDVTARPTVEGANWPIQVPPMFWLSAAVSGGASVITQDGCFVECKPGVVATFTSGSEADEYYECHISNIGYSSLASGDNLVTVSQENGVTSFTMCPKDTYSGVLPVGGRIGVKYSLIPVARWGVAGIDGERPTTANYGTLEDAIAFANNLSSGTAYIELLRDVNTTTPLAFAEDKTTILDLNGKTIDRGLTELTSDGSVFYVHGTLTLCDTSANKDGKITGGYSNGGGVNVGSDGTFHMLGGIISGNNAPYHGGGVMVYGGTFTMSGGLISQNTTKYGAGVFVISGGEFTMNGGTISENTASSYGGGVSFENSTFTMSGGVISGNTARDGGGVDCGSTFTMSGGAIVGNNVTDNGGGGVYITSVATMQVSGTPYISGNVRNGTLNDVTGRYELGTTGTIDNVFLSSRTINIVGALQDGAFVGVSPYSKPTDATSVPVAQGGGNPVYTLTANDAAKFSSDEGYAVELDSTNNKLVLTLNKKLKGDVNLDGAVNADDLTALARHVAKIEALTDDYALLNADVDDNGSLSADDLTKLARYVAKIIPSL